MSVRMNNILIADDIPEMRMLLRELLQPLGREILEAGDGIVARDLIIQHQPQLVLLDWHMPGLSGIDLVKAIRQRADITQPIIIMVSGQVDKDSAQALEAGVDDLISKPFEFDDFINLVQQNLH